MHTENTVKIFVRRGCAVRYLPMKSPKKHASVRDRSIKKTYIGSPHA